MMNTTRIQKRIATLAGLLFVASVLASSPVRAQGQQPAPDNSKTNKGDAANGATTADQQKMNPTDRTTAKQIRASIMKDKTLSTYAHNIKIISQDGKVTLKGPVRSEEEKSSIEAKASAVAGAGNVTDELTIAPPKS